MRNRIKKRERQSDDCRFLTTKKELFRLHPLFLIVGIWYALTGELFLFLMSALVALQHECAHAFAAAKLGYKLNRIVLMPFGAIIDGDLKGLSFKDEIYVALCGPLCNLITAAFFVALWWLEPTMYPFTDTACYSSLAIACINLLPAYPLDGGRILKCALARWFMKTQPQEEKAERKAEKICRFITSLFATLFFALFFLLFQKGIFHFSLFAFGLFLAVGGAKKGNEAFYHKIDVSVKNALKKGVEIRRIAILDSCPVKDALRFLTRGSYLVLEVYDEKERLLFELPQNEFALLFERAESPYTPIGFLYESMKKRKNEDNL